MRSSFASCTYFYCENLKKINYEIKSGNNISLNNLLTNNICVECPAKMGNEVMSEVKGLASDLLTQSNDVVIGVEEAMEVGVKPIGVKLSRRLES